MIIITSLGSIQVVSNHESVSDLRVKDSGLDDVPVPAMNDFGCLNLAYELDRGTELIV